jgi:DNA-binding NarL/FixJ family response regulator
MGCSDPEEMADAISDDLTPVDLKAAYEGGHVKEVLDQLDQELIGLRPVKTRIREIAALLIDGLTSKLIGKRLAISPRTVDVYRARLMRKVGAATTPELVNKLLAA